MTSMTANSTKTIFDGVCKEAGELLGEGKPITAMSRFVGDLGADSLDCVELVMALEDHFDVEGPDEDWEGLIYVGQAVRLLDKYLRKAGRPMDLGVDLSEVPEVQAVGETDWQIGHVENEGKTFVLYDMARSNDDEQACVVTVKGGGAKEMADKLVQLLRSGVESELGDRPEWRE